MPSAPAGGADRGLRPSGRARRLALDGHTGPHPRHGLGRGIHRPLGRQRPCVLRRLAVGRGAGRGALRRIRRQRGGVLRPATEADTEQPERVTLTLAHMDENSYIPSYIDEFNRTHSDIRVELLPEMPHEALVALMASDEAPDIIGFGYNSPESMAAKSAGCSICTHSWATSQGRTSCSRPFETDPRALRGLTGVSCIYPRRPRGRFRQLLCSPDIGF